jgi:hypothetical protein
MVFVTESEELFATYLDQRGLNYIYEPVMGNRAPDFLVAHPDDGEIVCEVTEITKMEPAGWIDPYRAARQKIKAKQKKASVVKGKYPYVIVLRFAIPHPSIEMIVPGAMYGDVGLTMLIDTQTGGPVEGSQPVVAALQGGRMQRERNTTISAVAVVEQFNPTKAKIDRSIRRRLREDATAVEFLAVANEEYGNPEFDESARLPRLDVFHNVFAALPVPPEFFAGPHDSRWEAIESTFTRTWTGGRFRTDLDRK